MNPLVVRQIQELELGLRDLKTLLEQAAERKQSQDAEIQRINQEQWTLRKQVNTLQHTASEYDKLNAQTEKLAAQRHAIEKRLKSILANTRALARHFAS